MNSRKSESRGREGRNVRKVSTPLTSQPPVDVSRLSEQWLLSPFISSTQLFPLYRDASLVAKFNYNKLTVLVRARIYPSRTKGRKREEGKIGSAVRAGWVQVA